MCWIRIVQMVLYTVDLINESMGLYIYLRNLYVCIKGFFNEYDKDEFEDARSKIHRFMLRTVCELKVHNATS